MKNSRNILLLSLAFLAGCTSSVDFSLPTDESLTLSIPAKGQSCAIAPGTTKHNLLVTWLAANQGGWERSPATHVPRLVVTGRDFSINFMDTSVILNYPGGQFTHKIPTADYALLVCDTRSGT